MALLLTGAAILMLGICIGRATKRAQTIVNSRFVFPNVTEAPLIYQVDSARLVPNNCRTQRVTEDGGSNDCSECQQRKDALRVLRSARCRGLG